MAFSTYSPTRIWCSGIPSQPNMLATHGFRDAAKAIGHGTRDTVHPMAVPTAERPNSQIPHVMVSLASRRAVVGPLQSGGGLLRTLSVGAASTDIRRWPLLSLPTRSPFFGRGFQFSLGAACTSSKSFGSSAKRPSAAADRGTLQSAASGSNLTLDTWRS